VRSRRPRTTDRAEVLSVEPVLSSLSISSLNIVFNSLTEIFSHHLPAIYTFLTQTSTNTGFLLLNALCSFMNDEIYKVKDFFNFHAQYVNAEQ